MQGVRSSFRKRDYVTEAEEWCQQQYPAIETLVVNGQVDEAWTFFSQQLLDLGHLHFDAPPQDAARLELRQRRDSLLRQRGQLRYDMLKDTFSEVHQPDPTAYVRANTVAVSTSRSSAPLAPICFVKAKGSDTAPAVTVDYMHRPPVSDKELVRLVSALG